MKKILLLLALMAFGAAKAQSQHIVAVSQSVDTTYALQHGQLIETDKHVIVSKETWSDYKVLPFVIPIGIDSQEVQSLLKDTLLKKNLVLKNGSNPFWFLWKQPHIQYDSYSFRKGKIIHDFIPDEIPFSAQLPWAYWVIGIFAMSVGLCVQSKMNSGKNRTLTIWTMSVFAAIFFSLYCTLFIPYGNYQIIALILFVFYFLFVLLGRLITLVVGELISKIKAATT